MITSNTVFVLGAGASMPYGLPSGRELRERLCAGGDTSSQVAQALFQNCRVPYADIGRFSRVFRDSGIASIDAFLARRDEFSELGKLAIAAVLCALENPDTLHSPQDHHDHWYFALWNAMVSDVHTPDKLLDNEIKIVTFNYDRSLEFFLYTSIKNTFALTDAQAKEIVSSIPLKHVYGQLGDFGNGPDHIPYTTDIGDHRIKTAASTIQIIPEARDDAPVFEEIQNWFYEAAYICFLGFGFDPLNILRLRLRDVFEIRRTNPPVILASGFGLTDAELNTALFRLTGVGGVAPHLLSHDKSLMTLRNSTLLS